MMYYFFDEYGNCADERYFATEEEASNYCDKYYEYFCGDDDYE